MRPVDKQAVTALTAASRGSSEETEQTQFF